MLTNSEFNKLSTTQHQLQNSKILQKKQKNGKLCGEQYLIEITNDDYTHKYNNLQHCTLSMALCVLAIYLTNKQTKLEVSWKTATKQM